MVLVWGAIFEYGSKLKGLISDVDKIRHSKRQGVKNALPPHGPPKSFKKHVDPQGQFEIQYPSEWDLNDAQGLQLFSKLIGSFARVDIGSKFQSILEKLKTGAEAAGGKLEIARQKEGDPEHVRGKLELGSVRYAWNAYAHKTKNGVAVLSLGNVIDRKRSKGIERYEDLVLKNIREHFRILPGL